MRGYIYNNPSLAYEEDGFYTFLGDKRPHAYWCVIRIHEKTDVMLAPVFFDFMDNLPNSVIDTCPVQIGEKVCLGRNCIIRHKDELDAEPVIYLNPDKVKQFYKMIARSLRGE